MLLLSPFSPYTRTRACRVATLWSRRTVALNRPRAVLFLYLLLAVTMLPTLMLVR
jgi:hypothetical protein